MSRTGRSDVLGSDIVTRRQAILALTAATGALYFGGTAWSKAQNPFRIPDTSLCNGARDFAREIYPPFLFNHCMRTYCFGVLHARRHHLDFDEEVSFVASVLHDAGLVARFEESGNSFEVSGADLAESTARRYGAGTKQASRIWNAVAFHDLDSVIVGRQRHECLVVAWGAAADVVGPDNSMFSPAEVSAVLDAYPRLGFKREFLATLDAHCTRQPGSQQGTWLGSYCANLSHDQAQQEPARSAIERAPFAE